MQNHHQPQYGATRTGMMDSRRFTPYGEYNARLIAKRPTVAGLPTHVHLPVLHYAPQTIQPTGGLSETAANAEKKQTITEEYESPVSDFYCSLIPHVIDRLFDVRRPKPGAPVVKGYHASTARGPATVPANSGSGRGRRGVSGHSRATKTRSLVSTRSSL